jgi:hypothetical protein
METTEITLITVIANLILQPLLQYLLHSRCNEVDICCIHCKRDVLDEQQIKQVDAV